MNNQERITKDKELTDSPPQELNKSLEELESSLKEYLDSLGLVFNEEEQGPTDQGVWSWHHEF